MNICPLVSGFEFSSRSWNANFYGKQRVEFFSFALRISIKSHAKGNCKGNCKLYTIQENDEIETNF